MGDACMDRCLTMLAAVPPERGDFLRAGRRCLVPTETPAPLRVVRHNELMEPDTAARAYGFVSFAAWCEAVRAEMRWGTFDPSRPVQLAAMFAEPLEPVTAEGAALLRAWEAAAPPVGDLDPLYAGGWVTDDGRCLTVAATRVMIASLDAMERASR